MAERAAARSDEDMVLEAAREEELLDAYEVSAEYDRMSFIQFKASMAPNVTGYSTGKRKPDPLSQASADAHSKALRSALDGNDGPAGLVGNLEDDGFPMCPGCGEYIAYCKGERLCFGPEDDK